MFKNVNSFSIEKNIFHKCDGQKSGLVNNVRQRSIDLFPIRKFMSKRKRVSIRI